MCMIGVCVCVCECMHVCVCVYVHTQTHTQVCVVLIVGVDRYIPLTMLVDACQCCRLLMFVICLLHFETLSLLLNLVNKNLKSHF